MKSLSVRPLILCVQVVISTFPGKKDIWVVPLLLRKFTHAVHKPEGFAKIWELERLSDAVLVYHIPSIHLLLQRGEFLTFQRWDAATAWDAGFGCQV
jgi:hypothetical protein